VADLAGYLELTVGQAREQFRALLVRRPVSSGRPPLRDVLLLPPGAQEPARKYLDWHKQKIFVR
jgi:hypothetical protein